MLGFAGLWSVAVPWLQHPVLVATERLGLRSAVLITATVLFFPPLVLLGMVSPYAIRIKATMLEVVGRTAGNLYAISTLASVAAAIATGFFLIPNMGVSRLMFLIGIVLVVTALVGLAFSRKGASRLAVIIIVPVIAAAALWTAPVQQADPDAGLISIEHSAYAEIRVVDRNGVRFMLIDGGTHTIVEAE